jgi:hypothetical protein
MQAIALLTPLKTDELKSISMNVVKQTLLPKSGRVLKTLFIALLTMLNYFAMSQATIIVLAQY